MNLNPKENIFLNSFFFFSRFALKNVQIVSAFFFFCFFHSWIFRCHISGFFPWINLSHWLTLTLQSFFFFSMQPNPILNQSTNSVNFGNECYKIIPLIVRHKLTVHLLPPVMLFIKHFFDHMPLCSMLENFEHILFCVVSWNGVFLISMWNSSLFLHFESFLFAIDCLTNWISWNNSTVELYNSGWKKKKKTEFFSVEMLLSAVSFIQYFFLILPRFGYEHTLYVYIILQLQYPLYFQFFSTVKDGNVSLEKKKEWKKRKTFSHHTVPFATYI